MSEETLFSKIIDRQVPAHIVYEDEKCLAFRDINPQAPMHILLIPKQIIPMLSTSAPEDQDLLGHLLLVAPKIARDQDQESFRLVINNGADAHQTVYHLHLHIIGGRRMGWPPG